MMYYAFTTSSIVFLLSFHKIPGLKAYISSVITMPATHELVEAERAAAKASATARVFQNDDLIRQIIIHLERQDHLTMLRVSHSTFQISTEVIYHSINYKDYLSRNSNAPLRCPVSASIRVRVP